MNATPITISNMHCCGNRKKNPTIIHMASQGTKNSQDNFKKEEQSWGDSRFLILKLTTTKLQ